jgi:VWFA-related protein
MFDSFESRLRWRSLLRLLPFTLFLPFAAILAAQAPQQGAPPPSPPTTQTNNAQPTKAPELATHDTANAFKVRVNLVLVRVVVRDRQGHVIKNLHKEDFRLFDSRKEQTIASFSVETPSSHVIPVKTVPLPGEAVTPSQTPAEVALPERFVALLFDDIHLEMGDAVTARAAATKILDSLGPSDRVAIYTTSGQFSQDFTSDKDLLRKALLSIIPHPLSETSVYDCPNLSYYMADLIENKNDPQALAAATQDALACAFNNDPRMLSQAQALAQVAAERALTTGDTQATYTFSTFASLIRRVSAMPGQRSIVFISPGFLLTTLYTEESDLIDRAIRSNIVVDTLDARGLYTPDLGGDISNPAPIYGATAGIESSYRVASQMANEDILRDVSSATGGTYYHNRNDLDVALREAVAAPPVSYLLAFSPQNLKLNGAFHNISVKLAMKNDYNIEARKGYYAPRTLKDPAEQAKEEIQEAVFSQDEINDIPIELQTQFFKKDETDAELSVLAHVDVNSLPFQKADGRNRDNLTLATALFDENGNFVTGSEKILEMRLFDTTLTRLQRSGITVKTSFDVKPGNYLVRLVVRDAQGEEMAARNGAVAIPY